MQQPGRSDSIIINIQIIKDQFGGVSSASHLTREKAVMVAFQDANVAGVAVPGAGRRHRLAYRAQLPQLAIRPDRSDDILAHDARVAHHHGQHIGQDVEQNERADGKVQPIGERVDVIELRYHHP